MSSTATQQLESVPNEADPRFIEGQTSDFEGWLASNKPSKANPVHPWIWIRCKKDVSEPRDPESYMQMVGEAMSLGTKLEADAQAIKDDDTIPIRTSKKKLRNKKIAREELCEEAKQKLAEMAKKYGDVTGKWLFFESEERCDEVWEKIARALIEDKGALRDTAAHTAKISTTAGGDGGGGPDGRRVICLYCRDSWNREEVKKVLEVVTKELGLFTQSYKADIVTLAGINSNHPSGIKSTLYNDKDFFTKEELQAMRDSKKGQAKRQTAEEELKDGDPFATDSDEEPPAKKAKT